jgi:hypothetical protein
MRVVSIIGLALVVGCELPEESGLDLPPASTFSCDSLDGSEDACIDFNDGDDRGMRTEGGAWTVADGWYVGEGPETVGGDCTDSLLTHAIIPDIEAQDAEVRMTMAALERVDKAIVLRSVDAANRIQLNFRASEAGDYGDLMVQEVLNCEFVRHTTDGEIAIPHNIGEAVDVRVDLIGTHLRVVMNGDLVLDRDFPALSVRSGAIGMAVIDNSMTVFDDVVIKVLDSE